MQQDSKRRPGSKPPPGVLSSSKALGSFGALGLELLLSLAFPLLACGWLDGRLGSAPWLMLFGGVIGIGAAVKALMRAARRATIEAERIARKEAEARARYLRGDRELDDDDPDDGPDRKP